MAAVTSVTRAAQLYMMQIDAVLKPFDLTFARYEVLALLSFTRAGALPLGKLGDRLQVHPASVTNAVDRLEVDGLVRRRSNPRDARGTLAEITAHGRRLVSRVTPLLNEEVFTRVGLTAPEQTQMLRLLEKIRQRSGDFT